MVQPKRFPVREHATYRLEWQNETIFRIGSEWSDFKNNVEPKTIEKKLESTNQRHLASFVSRVLFRLVRIWFYGFLYFKPSAEKVCKRNTITTLDCFIIPQCYEDLVANNKALRLVSWAVLMISVSSIITTGHCLFDRPRCLSRKNLTDSYKTRPNALLQNPFT